MIRKNLHSHNPNLNRIDRLFWSPAKRRGQMMKVLICSLGILLASFNGIAEAEDLGKIDRALDKQPAYTSKEPKYCLLVFGP